MEASSDSKLVTIIFPNYSLEPVVQKWRVGTLKMIPYFDTLFGGKWKDSCPEEITLEFDPLLFTKMVKELKAKNAEEEYDLMKDFFGVTQTKKESPLEKYRKAGLFRREEFYQTLIFTPENDKQIIDLTRLKKANKVYSMSLSSPGLDRRAHNVFSYKLNGMELGGGSYKGVPRDIADIINAYIAGGKSLENFQIGYGGDWDATNNQEEVKAYLKIIFE
jgi:hypothetical protein